MAVYEYKCDKGHEFTAEQPINDDALASCSHPIGATDAGPQFCNAPCQRLISKSSFVLKGAGWTPKGGV